MEAQRKIQPLVCGNPCWSGSVALEEVLSEARQRQRRDPPCHVHQNAQGDPPTQIHQPRPHIHTRTKKKKKKGLQVTQRDTLWLWSVGESRAAKKGSFPENVPKCVTFVEGEFNVLSSRVLLMSPRVFWKGGYLRQESTWSAEKKKPRRRPKQKAGEKCSISSRLQTAPGV